MNIQDRWQSFLTMHSDSLLKFNIKRKHFLLGVFISFIVITGFFIWGWNEFFFILFKYNKVNQGGIILTYVILLRFFYIIIKSQYSKMVQKNLLILFFEWLPNWEYLPSDGSNSLSILGEKTGFISPYTEIMEDRIVLGMEGEKYYISLREVLTLFSVSYGSHGGVNKKNYYYVWKIGFLNIENILDDINHYFIFHTGQASKITEEDYSRRNIFLLFFSFLLFIFSVVGIISVSPYVNIIIIIISLLLLLYSVWKVFYKTDNIETISQPLLSGKNKKIAELCNTLRGIFHQKNIAVTINNNIIYIKQIIKKSFFDIGLFSPLKYQLKKFEKILKLFDDIEIFADKVIHIKESSK